METIETQAEEIKAIKAIMQQSASQRRYSEVATSGNILSNTLGSLRESPSSSSGPSRHERPQRQDKRPVSIDTGRVKGARNDYNGVRNASCAGLKVNKVTEQLTIEYLRPDPGDRIDVIFADKDGANKAKQHRRQLTSSLLGARIKVEQWYPVKSDSVVKQCVLDGEKSDGRTLKKDFLKYFREPFFPTSKYNSVSSTLLLLSASYPYVMSPPLTQDTPAET
ncbi:hypothetical protein LTR78_001779 [Recurvomyces mirabilis]|uniref:Uncharacterized protein n=1 Tax=Recurvomyces mirabilis TaxID=574656 RepID=A0AAE1C559_9PEZI|nr:hypothetical protein LTR78_001779 [Recurvomyces mirabilis]KAK5156782.1 hypothetical protein LTS14_004995 [Recurvomyces mirabilis]